MRTALRRLRGALLNGLVWAVGWGLAAAVLSAGLQIILARRVPAWGAVSVSLILGGVLGLIAGMAFSLALSLLFRNRSLHDVSTLSFTLTGAAVAAFVLPGAFFLPALLSGSITSATPVVISLVVVGGIGGATAFGMIRLAKTAPDRHSELEHGLAEASLNSANHEAV